jgi:hypothetical protein
MHHTSARVVTSTSSCQLKESISSVGSVPTTRDGTAKVKKNLVHPANAPPCMMAGEKKSWKSESAAFCPSYTYSATLKIATEIPNMARQAMADVSIRDMRSEKENPTDHI